MMIETTYTDENGVLRTVQLPDDENDPSLGIPVDIYDILDSQLYEDAPLSFRQKFYEALRTRGIIKPTDLNKRNATDLIISAYRSAIKYEANSAIDEIKRFMAHDQSSAGPDNRKTS